MASDDTSPEAGFEAEGPVGPAETSLAVSNETPDVVPEGLVSNDEEPAVVISEKPLDSPDVPGPADSAEEVDFTKVPDEEAEGPWEVTGPED